MTDLTVLHTLRCMGFTDLARVASAAGLPPEEAESRLIDLAVEGLVTRTPGAFGGWGLTEAGKTEDARLVAEELDKAGAHAAVTSAYTDFMVLNPELMDLSTAWHLRTVDGVAAVNDHTDAAYDARVLARFADLDRRVSPVCAALTAALPRFGSYRTRLSTALARGDLAESTESYHNVWFQLHENLLVTLGIPR
ncbi:transcriptional regulator [Actinoplanes hulinensis]|uniref:Transcriptional regulator n=1 Tax=Actinoplanes hulinensis TaxID=1144547 RepID=A0ABS7B589_9ACTN|nr:transcriptional regulator [Actinoplanes hulinensis]MBW6435594.1 transcriptional regulator [Actinoplanes hulinensis]